MFTLDDMVQAPMFTVFHDLKGKCAVPEGAKDEWWDEFVMHGATVCDQEVRDRARSLEVKLKKVGPCLVEIERDDELAPKDFCDDDARLCYLNAGGVLVSLPDTMGSQYWRYYVVEKP